MLHPVYPGIFARSVEKRTENRRRIVRETRRGHRGEEKSPESTRETRGGEWEEVNVIAVIFGRWLLPGSSLLLLLLGSNPLPSPSYGNIHPSSSSSFSLSSLSLSRSHLYVSHFESSPPSFSLHFTRFFFLFAISIPLSCPVGWLCFFVLQISSVLWQFARLDIRRPICRVQRSSRSSCNDWAK